MAKGHRAQPLADNWYWPVPSPFDLALELSDLRRQSLAHRVPQYDKLPIPGFPAYMGKSQEIERLRFASTATLAVACRKTAELDNTRLAAVQLQVECAEAILQISIEPLGIFLVLEADHKVITEPDDDHIAAAAILSPLVRPQVKGVVKVDVRQQRADDESSTPSADDPPSLLSLRRDELPDRC